MGMINVSSNDKDIESTNLEAHVAMCAQRHSSLEGKIKEIKEQNDFYKKVMFRAGIALGTSAISGATALLFHLSGKVI